VKFGLSPDKRGYRKSGFRDRTKNRDLEVLGPFKTTIILSAALQEGFLGWGNGLDRGFQVATGKTVVFGVFGISLRFVV